MTALTLPQPDLVTAEAVIATGWAVVDGVRRGGEVTLTNDLMEDLSRTFERVPDPRWLAAMKCETCDGLGWVVEGQTIGWPYGEQIQCGACLGAGKPRIPVTAPCVTCEGRAWFCGHCGPRWRWHHDLDCAPGKPACPAEGCENGHQSVGWVTVTKVLAVWRWSDKDIPYRSGTKYIVTNTPGVPGVHLWADAKWTDITAAVAHLGTPESLVNRFLLKLEVVS